MSNRPMHLEILADAIMQFAQAEIEKRGPNQKIAEAHQIARFYKQGHETDDRLGDAAKIVAGALNPLHRF